MQSNWESYARARVYLFSHGDGFRERIPNASTAASRLGRYGVELATGGDSDVESIAWHKDTAQPCGTMTITLKPRTSWGTQIGPNDILYVFMTGDKNSAERLISIVSVDTISDIRTVDGSNATITVYQLSCRDIGGKVLTESPTVYDNAVAFTVAGDVMPEVAAAFFSDTGPFASPSVAITQVLSIWFSLQQSFVTQGAGVDPTARVMRPWLFPGSDITRLTSLLDYKTHVQTPMIGATAVKPSAVMAANTLWSVCDMFANRLVNEFFIDIRDGSPDSLRASNRAAVFAQKFLNANGEDPARDCIKVDNIASTFTELSLTRQRAIQNPVRQTTVRGSVFQPTMSMVHRQLPYDTFSFLMLPENVVHETEVFDASISRSNHDVYNMFRVSSPGLLTHTQEDITFGLTINRKSIERHGIRRYEGETSFMFPGPNRREAFGKGSHDSYLKPTYDYYMGLLTTWNAHNDLMWTGNITTRLRPEIRIGQRLTYTRTHLGHSQTLDFYIQAVSHTFSAQQGSSRTSLSLIRGVDRYSNGPETALFWDDRGRNLGDRDPYEIVLPEKLDKAQRSARANDGGVSTTTEPCGPGSLELSDVRMTPRGDG